jgi:hypothetical protein
VQNSQYQLTKRCLEKGTSANCELIIYEKDSIRPIRGAYFKQTIETHIRILCVAIQNKDTAIIRLLLDYGASPNKAKWRIRDTLENTTTIKSNQKYQKRLYTGTFYALLDMVSKNTDDPLRKLLLSYNAKSWEYQITLGKRFSELVSHIRLHPDSVSAYWDFLRKYTPDEIEFSDQRTLNEAFGDCIEFGVLSGLKFLVEVKYADPKLIAWMTPCTNLLSQSICYDNDSYDPDWVFFSKYLNIPMIEYMLSKNLISNEALKYLYNSKKAERDVQKYYLLRKKLTNHNLSSNRQYRIKKRMDRLYVKAQKQIPDL